MHFGLLEILTLIGAVGLFLYGMKLMSEGIQKAAGDRLRRILSLMTSNRWLGALTGIFITVLVQSSSATTVMVVSFVNAGLISLAESISVIMGANIGTTATAWIISLFGFKVNISAFAVPLIAFAVPLLFAKKNSWKNWGEFLLGFALLFMGLDFLNNSVPDLQSHPEVFSALQSYANMGFWSVLLFLIVGLVLTMVVQASSATFAIALIMCSKGWIPFDCTAAMVLGSNIGTCITPILASVSGNVLAKRAAMCHLLFNVFGLLWSLPAFYLLVDFIVSLSGSVGDPNELIRLTSSLDEQTLNALNNGTLNRSIPENVALIKQFTSAQFAVSFALSLFHTVFNCINFCVMIWFTNLYEKIVIKLVPSNTISKADDEVNHLQYISTGIMSTAELSILQAKKEIEQYGKRTMRMYKMTRDLFHSTDENEFTKIFTRIEKYENISDRMEVEIAEYLGKVSDGRLSDDTKHQIQKRLRVVSEIESVADSCNNLSKVFRRYHDGTEKYTSEINANIELMFNLLDAAMSHMLLVLAKDHIEAADFNTAEDNEHEINNFNHQLKNQNLDDLNDGKYSYTVSVTYMDAITEFEKMGDSIVNIVEAIAETKYR